MIEERRIREKYEKLKEVEVGTTLCLSRKGSFHESREEKLERNMLLLIIRFVD